MFVRFDARVKPIDLEVRNTLGREARVEIAPMTIAVVHTKINFGMSDLHFADTVGMLASFVHEALNTSARYHRGRRYH